MRQMIERDMPLDRSLYLKYALSFGAPVVKLHYEPSHTRPSPQENFESDICPSVLIR